MSVSWERENWWPQGSTCRFHCLLSSGKITIYLSSQVPYRLRTKTLTGLGDMHFPRCYREVILPEFLILFFFKPFFLLTRIYRQPFLLVAQRWIIFCWMCVLLFLKLRLKKDLYICDFLGNYLNLSIQHQLGSIMRRLSKPNCSNLTMKPLFSKVGWNCITRVFSFSGHDSVSEFVAVLEKWINIRFFFSASQWKKTIPACMAHVWLYLLSLPVRSMTPWEGCWYYEFFCLWGVGFKEDTYPDFTSLQPL